MTTLRKLARAFKDGLTRRQVARRYRVPMETVDKAIRASMRGKGKR